MKARLTDKHLRRFYRLLSVPMIDFDCGQLCAPDNEGVPYCCDNSTVVPVLFRDELGWHRKNGGFWKRMPVRTKDDQKMTKELCSYNIYSVCPGPEKCIRSKRSLICMTFPFEPYVDRSGRVLGLVYKNDENDGCPLVGKPGSIYNPVYITNSILFWQELLDMFPEEKELYMEESQKHRRMAKRKRRKLRIITRERGMKHIKLLTV